MILIFINILYFSILIFLSTLLGKFIKKYVKYLNKLPNVLVGVISSIGVFTIIYYLFVFIYNFLLLFFKINSNTVNDFMSLVFQFFKWILVILIIFILFKKLMKFKHYRKINFNTFYLKSIKNWPYFVCFLILCIYTFINASNVMYDNNTDNWKYLHQGSMVFNKIYILDILPKFVHSNIHYINSLNNLMSQPYIYIQGLIAQILFITDDYKYTIFVYYALNWFCLFMFIEAIKYIFTKYKINSKYVLILPIILFLLPIQKGINLAKLFGFELSLVYVSVPFMPSIFALQAFFMFCLLLIDLKINKTTWKFYLFLLITSSGIHIVASVALLFTMFIKLNIWIKNRKFKYKHIVFISLFSLNILLFLISFFINLNNVKNNYQILIYFSNLFSNWYYPLIFSIILYTLSFYEKNTILKSFEYIIAFFVFCSINSGKAMYLFGAVLGSFEISLARFLQVSLWYLIILFIISFIKQTKKFLKSLKKKKLSVKFVISTFFLICILSSYTMIKHEYFWQTPELLVNLFGKEAYKPLNQLVSDLKKDKDLKNQYFLFLSDEKSMVGFNNRPMSIGPFVEFNGNFFTTDATFYQNPQVNVLNDYEKFLIGDVNARLPIFAAQEKYVKASVFKKYKKEDINVLITSDYIKNNNEEQILSKVLKSKWIKVKQFKSNVNNKDQIVYIYKFK